MKALILVIDSIWEDTYPEMKCKMVWNKRISQCLFMERVNWVTQVPHIERLLFLQTAVRSVVFLILGTLYTSRISILWVFPGLTGHWWPIGSYDKGQFLFYTSDVKIVKFLAKKSVYSLVNIELQKYLSRYGENTINCWHQGTRSQPLLTNCPEMVNE